MDHRPPDFAGQHYDALQYLTQRDSLLIDKYGEAVSRSNELQKLLDAAELRVASETARVRDAEQQVSEATVEIGDLERQLRDTERRAASEAKCADAAQVKLDKVAKLMAGVEEESTEGLVTTSPIHQDQAPSSQPAGPSTNIEVTGMPSSQKRG